jgi:hypothetical protein
VLSVELHDAFESEAFIFLVFEMYVIVSGICQFHFHLDSFESKKFHVNVNLTLSCFWERPTRLYITLNESTMKTGYNTILVDK